MHPPAAYLAVVVLALMSLSVDPLLAPLLILAYIWAVAEDAGG